MKYLLTSSLGRGRTRITVLSRVSIEMLQPWLQPGQIEGAWSSSHDLALFSESLERSAPTGQTSITLPAQACVNSLPSYFPLTARTRSRVQRLSPFTPPPQWRDGTCGSRSRLHTPTEAF